MQSAGVTLVKGDLSGIVRARHLPELVIAYAQRLRRVAL